MNPNLVLKPPVQLGNAPAGFACVYTGWRASAEKDKFILATEWLVPGGKRVYSYVLMEDPKIVLIEKVWDDIIQQVTAYHLQTESVVTYKTSGLSDRPPPVHVEVLGQMHEGPVIEGEFTAIV